MCVCVSVCVCAKANVCVCLSYLQVPGLTLQVCQSLLSSTVASLSSEPFMNVEVVLRVFYLLGESISEKVSQKSGILAAIGIIVCPLMVLIPACHQDYINFNCVCQF